MPKSASNTSQDNSQKRKHLSGQPLADQLKALYLRRIRDVATRYPSLYLLSYEITMYEILLIIFQKCFEKDAPKIEPSLMEGMPPVRSKSTTIRRVLEAIQEADISGRLTQICGLPHLWRKHANPIEDSDIFLFSNFINANYVNVFQSCSVSDGAVWILSDTAFDEKLIAKTSKEIEQEIIGIVNNYNPIEISASMKKSNVPNIKMHNVMIPNLPPCADGIRRLQEQLGRLYLMEIVHSWHLKKRGKGRKKGGKKEEEKDEKENEEEDEKEDGKDEKDQVPTMSGTKKAAIAEKEKLLKEKEKELQKLMKLLVGHDEEKKKKK